MRNYILGGFAALTLIVVAACGGGQGSPGIGYPVPPNVSSGTFASSAPATIALPAVSGLAVGSAKVSGVGSVTVAQSVTNPSAVPVLALKKRDATGAAAAANTPLAYVTVTATSNSTISQINLTVSPTATIPSGTYYLAYWDGAQWVTVGPAATISGSLITVTTGTINPPGGISLASGSSLYLAIYTGQIFVTPTPPPPAPVASPASLNLSVGQTGPITVTSGAQITITAASKYPNIASVAPTSQSTGMGTTVTFTVKALSVGTSTITFTDPLGHTGSTTVTVNDNSPTPEPSPASATVGLGDDTAVAINADPNTLITITSTNGAVAKVATGSPGAIPSTPPVAPSAGSFGTTATVTTDSNGQAYFWVNGFAGGMTNISLADPSVPANTGVMSVTVSAVTNGTFTNGTTGWAPCSYAHTALAGPINPATPTPATPVPSQSPAATLAAVAAGSLPAISATSPPGNDNPNMGGNASGDPTPPAVLGKKVGFTGTIDASVTNEPKGEFGMCQSITVPASASQLSFWVYEGGSNYAFKTADQNAEILDSTGTTIKTTLFAEQNCYLHPTVATPAGIWGGSGTFASSGCWPQAYGGDTSNFYDWIGGGYWNPRGPYDLSAYAGTTVVLYIGNFSFNHYTNNYQNAFIYVGNVQMTSLTTFPVTAPLDRTRSLGTIITLPRRTSH